MKTLVKVILVVAVMFGTYASYALDNAKNYETSHFVSEGNRISVYNSEGTVIYSGKVKNSGNLTRLYDFTQLDNGVYTIEINKDFEIEVSSIEVKNKKVKFVHSKERIFKPVFRNKDSRLIISKLGVDTNEMNVTLYFEDNLIYSDTVKGDQVLNRVYRLDESLPGEYTAVVKFNNRVFTENFRI
ncbi:hypothetical protein [Winogradskyella alexanderae]|uniref:Por secretion system C-terminal sorting domain-containing protein n=1 Tax=Winogradskyella alexanderae TaxID=2877123 RepID=A0ABS7XN00_9FLAO|nr:hypothetical protein [Winogradskyella alexanderae]MCA0131382.1 hypothetical protein [Winogradskyella alexanderae]